MEFNLTLNCVVLGVARPLMVTNVTFRNELIIFVFALSRCSGGGWLFQSIRQPFSCSRQISQTLTHVHVLVKMLSRRINEASSIRWRVVVTFQYVNASNGGSCLFWPTLILINVEFRTTGKVGIRLYRPHQSPPTPL